MDFLKSLMTNLQNHPKRVVFAEGADPRIIQAARQFATYKLGVPILLGERALIKENAAQLNISLDKIRIIDPSRSDDFDFFSQKLSGLKRFLSFRDKEIEEFVLNNNYYATLMLATSRADAIVSGATVAASSALRPMLQILPLQPHVKTISSVLILNLEESENDLRDVLFLSDTAVVPNPNEEQLADMAITAAALRYHLTNQVPHVAMLSYTTKTQTSQRPEVLKVKAATEIAQQKAKLIELPMDIDGEMQVDAALDARTAEIKKVDSSVAGKANVLIFPDLNSANISSKMVQLLAGCPSYGQILTGFSKPAAEISRGASAHDILGTAIIVGCQAIDMRFLYPVGLKGQDPLLS